MLVLDKVHIRFGSSLPLIHLISLISGLPIGSYTKWQEEKYIRKLFYQRKATRQMKRQPEIERILCTGQETSLIIRELWFGDQSQKRRVPHEENTYEFRKGTIGVPKALLHNWGTAVSPFTTAKFVIRPGIVMAYSPGVQKYLMIPKGKTYKIIPIMPGSNHWVEASQSYTLK